MERQPLPRPPCPRPCPRGRSDNPVAGGRLGTTVELHGKGIRNCQAREAMPSLYAQTTGGKGNKWNGKWKGKRHGKRKAKWDPSLTGSEPARLKRTDARLTGQFPTLTVSVLWLADFVERNRTQLEGLTTSEVSAKLLKPETRGPQCAYTELLRGKTLANGSPCVAMANYFVSHAWGGLFLDTAEAIISWNQQQQFPGEAYVWLDIFSVNQHAPSQPSGHHLPRGGVIDRSHAARTDAVGRAARPEPSLVPLGDHVQRDHARRWRYRRLRHRADASV